MSSNATGSDETLVNIYTTGNQYGPSTIALADGGWLVTWYGEGTADNDGVYQQRYGADGATVGTETLVNSYVTGNQHGPSTTALADGGWLVTWTGEGAEDAAGVYQQRYGADGATVGTETLVNSYVTGNQISPSTTALADGGWLVTWTGESAADTFGVYQQRYGADGEAIGTETLVNTYVTGNQDYSSTTTLADGGWVVTWYGEGTGDSQGVYQQRYGADGNTVGSETLINAYTTGSQVYPSTTALADGGWLVTWHGEGTEDSGGLYQQRYSADGNMVGPETLINTYTTNFQLYPTVTALADGGWLVTWCGEGAGDLLGIYQQRYAEDGATVGSETLVNAYTTGNQLIPVTTALADGGWVVTWYGEGTGDASGIYQRHFAADIDSSNHADKLAGTGWDEYLIGYGGNDRLDGKGGNDVLIGGFGDDTYIVNSKGDDVQEFAAQGTDTVLASIRYTLGGTVENLTLTGKANINATGNALANHLTGNAGNNVLKGLAGADIITSGTGADKLYGGADADHFIFMTGDGADTIKDFDAKGSDHDVIDLGHVKGLTDFADLRAHHIEQAGSAVVIDFAAHDSITLEGVKINHLSAADFTF